MSRQKRALSPGSPDPPHASAVSYRARGGRPSRGGAAVPAVGRLPPTPRRRLRQAPSPPWRRSAAATRATRLRDSPARSPLTPPATPSAFSSSLPPTEHRQGCSRTFSSPSGGRQQLQDACQAALPPGFTSCTARLLNIFTRQDAYNSDNVAAIEDASTDGVFILGGDQTIAMSVLADTPVESAMADAYKRGVVFGGTSAGDAVESSSMIWGFTQQGSAATELQQGAIEIWWGDDGDSERGLVFGSANTILDQHFYQEGRFGRLVNAVAQSDDHFGGKSKLGIGVDYGTGALLTNDASLPGFSAPHRQRSSTSKPHMRHTAGKGLQPRCRRATW